ncbi:hypothetical protein LTR56_006622 [Elasticomyces elasticus]|nr:hypothetical protein LTR56_006622 [Elasticomyces elasticus]KAK3664491.1 hypothetical protein LTR22_004625 [Elasticomyces elasticus]KAK4931788.1 hypothetical protein LTR49_001853 [Elasticomyces elasticus]KAK5762900.1 hypothetical protein LTS12_006887 [Elasticomyces elasticus]
MAHLPPPVVYDPSQHQPVLHQMTQMHADCVIQDGTLATFLPDVSTGEMDIPKILKHWQSLSTEVERGSRVIILQFIDEAESELMGFVSLSMPFSETGPFRGGVEKLLVSPQHRKNGVARRVMGKLEEVGVEKGRTVLVLDTTIGSGAEYVYPKLGYTEIGIIPKYGIHPHTRELMDEMLFYKDLR